MVRWVCPCREQSGIDQGLRVSHSLCFWNLVLGETFWPKPCRRICPADSGVTVSPLRNGVLQEMMEVYFPLWHRVQATAGFPRVEVPEASSP